MDLVAFDFDGTLTVRDSFTGFLEWRRGRAAYLAGLPKLAPALAAYVVRRDRGALKSAAVRAYLKDLPRAALEGEVEAYAEACATRLFRPDALAVWNAWGARGATRLIVSASPDVVVAPFARRLGADELIATTLAFDAQDRVAGAFATPNCRAAEKVVRLKARFGEDVRLRAAYGDTSGDHEMLQLAEEKGYRVFTAEPRGLP